MKSKNINLILSVTVPLIFKNTREFHKLDQRQFAEKIGCTQGTVSKIENGKMLPTLENMVLFCHNFDAKIDDFTRILE